MARDTVEPEASLPSACRSFRMICSGECLFPIESPPFAHSGLLGTLIVTAPDCGGGVTKKHRASLTRKRSVV